MNIISGANQHQYSAASADSTQDRGGSSAAPANSTQDRSCCSAAPANSTQDRSGFSLKKTVVPSSADRVNPSVNIHPPTTHLNYYGIPIIAGEWKKYYECRIQNVWRSNIFVCAGSGGEIKTTPILHSEGNKNVFKCNIFGGVRLGTSRAVYLGVFRTFAKEYIATSSDSKLILMKSKPLNRTIRKIEHPDSRYFYIYKTQNGNYCFESMLHNGWFWRVGGNIGLVLECKKEELVETREDMQFTIINSKNSLGQG